MTSRSIYDAKLFEAIFKNITNAPGVLIAICGFDGSGKTTQIEKLANALRQQGREVVVTRQPTDWYRNDQQVREFLDQGKGGENIKAIALIAAADRLLHTTQVIEPALQRGAVVISDRYVFSSVALFVHRGLDAEFILRINQGIRRPDYAVYLDVPTTVLLERLRQRDGTKLKYEERSAVVIDAIKDEFFKLSEVLTFVDGAAHPDAVFHSICRVCRRLLDGESS